MNGMDKYFIFSSGFLLFFNFVIGRFQSCPSKVFILSFLYFNYVFGRFKYRSLVGLNLVIWSYLNPSSFVLYLYSVAKLCLFGWLRLPAFDFPSDPTPAGSNYFRYYPQKPQRAVKVNIRKVGFGSWQSERLRLCNTAEVCTCIFFSYVNATLCSVLE